VGLCLLELIIEGHISYFPFITATLLIIPIRQMTILTRDVDRISKKTSLIQRCLQIKAKTPEQLCKDKAIVKAKSKT